MTKNKKLMRKEVLLYIYIFLGGVFWLYLFV